MEGDYECEVATNVGEMANAGETINDLIYSWSPSIRCKSTSSDDPSPGDDRPL